MNTRILFACLLLFVFASVAHPQLRETMSPRTKIIIVLRNNLKIVHSFLYGASASPRCYLKREGRASSELDSLTEAQLGHLEEEAYQSALRRALRSVQILFDMIRNTEDGASVVSKFGLYAEFRARPYFETDLERIFETEAVAGVSHPSILESALEEIHRDHHPANCGEKLESN